MEIKWYEKTPDIYFERGAWSSYHATVETDAVFLEDYHSKADGKISLSFRFGIYRRPSARSHAKDFSYILFVNHSKIPIQSVEQGKKIAQDILNRLSSDTLKNNEEIGKYYLYLEEEKAEKRRLIKEEMDEIDV